MTGVNRRLIIYIPAVGFLALLVALLVINNYQPSAWKASLNQYLSYLQAEGDPSYRLVSAVKADKPMNFTPSMSAGTFSNNLTFKTDYNTSSVYLTGSEQVSYPPEAVWCALIENGGHQQLVYVALHPSQANAEWIVHEAPDSWGNPFLNSALDSIGCSF